MSERNIDLQTVADRLGDVSDSLRAARARETDPARVKTINDELIETSHRVVMVGAVLFHQRTAEITAAAEQVSGATGDLQEEIARLDDINNFIKAITGFLGLVDKVVDLAKMVAL